MAEVRCEGGTTPEPAQELALVQRMRVPTPCGSMPYAQEPGCHRVYVGNIEFVEITLRIDQYGPLQRFLRTGIVTNRVVSEIVEHLHCQKVTGRGNRLVPFENGLVYDLDL